MISLKGFQSYISTGALHVDDWERQEFAERLQDHTNRGEFPYDATVIFTGDMYLLALRSKETGTVEIRELTPVSVHWQQREDAK